MLTQQGLDDVITSSVPEQVAFLLVERAKLLDALENEVCTYEWTNSAMSYSYIWFESCVALKKLDEFIFNLIRV